MQPKSKPSKLQLKRNKNLPSLEQLQQEANLPKEPRDVAEVPHRDEVVHLLKVQLAEEEAADDFLSHVMNREQLTTYSILL